MASLNDIISERGACGVGFIANLKNEPSFKIIRDALTALGCMEHRGGCGADNDSGDGAGLMSAIPWDLYNNWASKQGLPSLDSSKTGVGMIFLPKNEQFMEEAKSGNASIYVVNHDATFYFRVSYFYCSINLHVCSLNLLSDYILILGETKIL